VKQTIWPRLHDVMLYYGRTMTLDGGLAEAR
jgi:hypothetical protein